MGVTAHRPRGYLMHTTLLRGLTMRLRATRTNPRGQGLTAESRKRRRTAWGVWGFGFTARVAFDVEGGSVRVVKRGQSP